MFKLALQSSQTSSVNSGGQGGNKQGASIPGASTVTQAVSVSDQISYLMNSTPFNYSTPDDTLYVNPYSISTNPYNDIFVSGWDNG